MNYKFDKENHIHLLDDKPLIGTSTVVNVLSKPLTWWASGLAVAKFGWLNKKDENGKFRTKEERLESARTGKRQIANLSDEKYLEKLDSAYSAHAERLDSSATAGTDLHAELERYVKYKIHPGEASVYEIKDERIRPFIEWADKNVKRFILSEAHTYSGTLWLGGILDCVAELNDGTIGIIDFKSAKDSYMSHFIQIAGYNLQLAENGAFDENGSPIYKLEKPVEWFAVVPFGAKEFKVDFKRNITELEDGFRAALTLHKLINV